MCVLSEFLIFYISFFKRNKILKTSFDGIVEYFFLNNNNLLKTQICRLCSIHKIEYKSKLVKKFFPSMMRFLFVPTLMCLLYIYTNNSSVVQQ